MRFSVIAVTPEVNVPALGAATSFPFNGTP
jgi:hypothetical protein